MAKNQETFVFNIQAKADVSDAQKKIAGLFKDAEKGMGSIGNSKTNNFLNTFQQAQQLAQKISEKMAKGVSTSSEAKDLLNDVKTFEKLSEQIKKTTGDMKINPQEFFPSTIIDRLRDAEKAVKASENSIEKLNNLKINIETQKTGIDKLKADIENFKKGTFGDVSKYTLPINVNTKTLGPQIKQAKQELNTALASGEGVETAKANFINVLNQALKSGENELSNYKHKWEDLKNINLNNLRESAKSLYNEIAQADPSKITEKFKNFNIDKATEASLRNFINNLKDVAPAAQQTKLDQLAAQAEQYGDAMSEAGAKVAVAGEEGRRGFEALSDTERAERSIKTLTNRIEYFFSLQNGFRLMERVIRSAFNTVKDLDKAMTDTAVVTDYTVGDMWNQLETYTAKANELGATTQGAYETMTLYYQQGLKDEAAWDLGVETMKMARIANMDYTEATNAMTAAVRGFNLELNAASGQRINDVYSKLAAVTASDTQEISTAMEKTASLAHNAGMDLETTAVYLTEAIETTREAPENIGTAMKTILARFQSLTKDPDTLTPEAQELLEGETVDANNVEAALRKAGVALRDEAGEFRNAKDVMLELNAVWNSLDKNTQRYIATQTAGARQQSRFIAMMQNYDRTMELVDAANNSAGASQEQFDKTLESLDSKLNRLKNAWNEFTMGLANNHAIKFVVDGLTDVLTIIDKLTGKSGNIISMFTRLAVSLAAFKGAGNILNKISKLMSGNIDAQLFDTNKINLKGLAGIAGKISGTLQNSISKGIDAKGIKNKLLSPIEAIGKNYKQNVLNITNPKLNAEGLKEYNKLRQEGVKAEEAYTKAQILSNTVESENNVISVLLNKTKAKQVAENYKNAASKLADSGATATLSAAEFIAIGMTDGWTAAVTALKTAYGGLLSILGPVLLLVAGIAAVKFDEQQISKAIESADEAAKNFNETTTKVKENISSLSEISGEYNKLAQGVNSSGQNIGLSANEFARYHEIVNQIAEISPSVVQGYDAEGNAIINKTTAIQDLIQAEQQELSQAKEEYASIDNLKNNIIKLNEANKETIKNNKLTASAVGFNSYTGEETGLAADSGKSTSDTTKKILDSAKTYRENKAALQKEITNLENIISATDNDTERIAAQEKLKTSKKDLEELESMNKAAQELKANYSDVISVLSTYASSLEGASYIEDNFNGILQAGIEEIAMSGKSAEEMQKDVSDLLDTFKKSPEALKAYKDGLREIETAKRELDENGYDTDSVEHYNEVVDKVYADMVANAQNFDDATNKAILSAAESIKNYASVAEKSLSEALNPMKDTITAAEKLGETLEDVSEHDYYVAAKEISDVIETAFSEENIEGRGSLTFWKTAEAVLGKDYKGIKNLNKEQTQQQMKLVQGWVSSKQGVYDFFNYLEKHQNDANLRGLYTFEDGVFDYDANKVAELAENLGLSEETFASLLQKARQFGDINFSNTDQLETALEKSFGFIKGQNGKTATYTTEKMDKSGKQVTKTVDKGYIWEDEVVTAGESQGLTAHESIKAVEDLGHTVLSLNSKASDLATSFNDIIGTGNSINKTNKETDSGTKVLSTMMAQNQSSANTAALFEKWAKEGYLVDFGKNSQLTKAYQDLVDAGEKATEEQKNNFESLLDDEFIDSQALAEAADPTVNAIDGTNSRLDSILAALGVLPTKFTKEEAKALVKNANEREQYTKNQSMMNGLSSEKRQEMSEQAKSENSILQKKIDDLETAINSGKLTPEDEAKAKDRQEKYQGYIKKNNDFIEANNKINNAQKYFSESGKYDNTDKDTGLTKVLEEQKSNKKSNINLDDYKALGDAITKVTQDEKQLSTVTDAYLAQAKGDLEEYTTQIDNMNPEVQTQFYSEFPNLAIFDMYRDDIESIEDESTKETIFKLIKDGNFDESSEEWQSIINSDDKTAKNIALNITGNTDTLTQTVQGLQQGWATWKPQDKSIKIDSSAAKTAKVDVDNFKQSWSKLKSETKTMTINVNKNTHKHEDAKGDNLGPRSSRSTQSFGSLAFGSAASPRRGKIGPHGQGGLTLTGELGPELVWEPSSGISYITGAKGPQIQDLPGDAVVWPADQTKKILASATGKNLFGSLSTGALDNYTAYKIYGYNPNTTHKSSKNAGKKKDKADDKLYGTLSRVYTLELKLNKALEQREKLLDKYDEFSEDWVTTYNDIHEYIKEIVAANQEIITKSTQIINNASKLRNDELVKAAGENGVKQSSILSYFKNGQLDQSKYNALAFKGTKSKSEQKLLKAVEAYAKGLEDVDKTLQEARDNIEEATKLIREQLKEAANNFDSALHSIKDALVEKAQQQIDKLSATNDAINDSNEKLINSINKTLDKQRQERENQKQEEDLASKRARLAALKRDTSGANAVAIKQLEKEIAEQEEGYTDTLIDQKISSLEEQNEEAREQRERQIDLLQQILDFNSNNGGFWEEARKVAEEAVKSNTNSVESEFYKLIQSTIELGETEHVINDTVAELRASLISLGEWQKAQTKVGNKISSDLIHKANTDSANGDAIKDESAIHGGTWTKQSNYDPELGTGTKGEFKTDNYTYHDAYYDQDGMLVYNSATKNTSTSTSTSSSNSSSSSSTSEAKTKYKNALAALKKKKPANVKSSDINNLFTLGSKAGKGKATVLSDIVSGKPFSWKNIFKAIINADGINRYNLVKTWPKGNGSLESAIKTLGSNPNTYAEVKKHKNYKSAKALKFKTGGLADYTGLAWLDGTPSKPEMVLNPRDTENFIQLKDILSDVMKSSSTVNNSGDNYYDINIRVDQLASDYDVDRLADRIKKQIVKDSNYRNVNAVKRMK